LTDGEPRTQRITFPRQPFALGRRRKAASGAATIGPAGGAEVVAPAPEHHRNGAPGTDSSAAAPITRTLEERFWLFPYVQPNATLVSTMQSFARAAGIAVSALGAAVLAGWTLDIAVLKSLSAGLASMKPNTAFSFLLAGGALQILSTGPSSTHMRLLSLVCAFAVSLIGILTLSQYLFVWNLDIDQLLFSEAPGAVGTSAPGRMAPGSAVCCFLLGTSLLVLDIRRCYPVAQLLTLFAALVALTALIGYVYGVESLYGVGSTTQMALHSSLGFLLLSSGILLTRQDHGLFVIVTSDAAGGVMARRLLPAAIVIPLAVGWLAVLGQHAGFHGPEFSVFLVVIWSALSFSALTWWNSGALYRLDAERQRAEEELKKGQAKLAEAQRIARVGSWEWDVPANHVTWSDEMYLNFGLAPGQFTPTLQGFLELVHPEDRERCGQTIELSLRTGEPFGFDHRIIRADGSVGALHTQGTVHRNDEGAVVAITGTGQDVTDRTRIEQALRQSESRTRSIIDSANDAFIAIDPSGTITDWNPQAEAIFGWTRDEAVGRSLHETIVPHSHREAHTEGLHRFVRSGEGPLLNKRIELTAMHKDGHLFPVELTVSPIRLGLSYMFSAFIRDITERKQAEEALAHKTEELTRMNSELEDFTHSVSHDLKEPLRGIEAFAGFIAEDYGDKLDEQGQRYVNVLRESAVHMKELIDDLLQLSRIGRTRVEYTPVSVRTLIEDVTSELSYTLEQKHAELRVEPSLPTIACDRVRMREVFKNLISNAAKYNDKPSPQIKVSCRSENGAFTFCVRDNGIGIDPQYHKKVFKIFQRLHHRDEYEGTGVGLAICKKVIEAHGGRIWIESAPGEGTAFLFTIPRTPMSEKEETIDGNGTRSL
jgi:PAS domain S-box-containing protein